MQTTTTNNISLPTYSALRYLTYLIIIILGITSLRVLLIQHQIWPVNGDETQYWNWSQHLAFGYYSKPPMLAWLISLFTHIFGNGLIGLRITSPLTHAITSLMCFFIGTRLYDQRIGFWAGIIYLLAPGVSFSSNLVSTDPPLMMFWSVAIYFLICAFESENLYWWLFAGLATGFAMLSKYAAIFIMISLLLYLLFEKELRVWYRRPHIYLMLLTVLIIILPNIYWNINHGFASILAVKDNADINATHHGVILHFDKLFQFLGAQFAIFGPILFYVLAAMLINWQKTYLDSRQRFLLWFVIPLLLVMSFEALISRAHGNWAAPIYVTASVAVAAMLIITNNFKWLLAAIVIHLFMLLGLVYFKPIANLAHIRFPAKMTTLNWQLSGTEIKYAYQDHPGSLLLSDDRMLLTDTMYFAKIPLRRSYKWNPNDIVKDQYDLVTHMQNEIGKNFIYVTYHHMPMNVLKHFKSYNQIEVIKQHTLDQRGTNLYVFYLKDFLGYK